MAKIPTSRLVDVIADYMSGEVSKVPRMTERFLLYGAIGAAKSKPDTVVGRFLPALSSVGIVDEEGYVCTDTIRAALEMAFSNVPSVDFMGFSFSAKDAAEVMRRLEA